jgi:hypothetical protein
MGKHNFYFSIWKMECRDRDGNLKWEESKQNALADEGESLMLDTFFRATNKPSTFFVRLFNDTPVETDNLAALANEVSGTGYAATEITRDSTGFPTLELNSGDYQVVSKQITFLANGSAWTAATYAVLSTTANNTGKLVAFVALSGTRTLADGDSLKVTITIKLQ